METNYLNPHSIDPARVEPVRSAAIEGHVVAYRTPYVSNACDAYRELFGRMKNGTAISSVDYPGTQIKADGLVMRTSKDKAGNVAHEMQAFGTLVSRREYPQKPTSGLIEEDD